MATDLKLLSSMATRQLLTDLLAAYRQTHPANVVAESVGGVDAAKRVQAGEAVDVVVLAAKAIDQLIDAGKLLPGRVDIVRSGVAVAVAAGAPQPSIADEAAVRAAVLAAPTLSYSTGPSGVYLEGLFARWGIFDAIKPRIVQAPPGVPVGTLVAEGQAALGFQQYSELMSLPGITVLGPLPPEIQTITTFSAGISSGTADLEAAQALLAWFADPATAAIKLRNGMEPA